MKVYAKNAIVTHRLHPLLILREGWGEFITMNPSQIKQLLFERGLRPNKNLGQHFLIDKNILGKIVDAADLHKNDLIMEVGPGLGVLTEALVERGAHVKAIEKDRNFIEHLSAIKNVEVEPGDAAKLDWNDLVKGKPWKFVSNLPYAITSLALRKALYEVDKAPELVVVLIQREVAERIAPRRSSNVTRPKMSLLSLMVALAAKEVAIVHRVPAGAFYPPPKVESAILKIVPRSHVARRTLWGIEPEEVMKTAKLGFAHPRKLLQRNLNIDNSRWEQMVQEIGINGKARAEELSVEQWVKLTKHVACSM